MSKKKCALIGYSGFIGKNLLHQYNNYYKSIDKYNSKNSHKLHNKEYNHVFCAAMPAEKWLANKFPKKDTKNRDRLVDNLKNLKTDLMILISSIDVHHNHTYGKNRKFLENFVKKKFKKYLIIRLPAVFGNGLKKNILFDLLNKNNLEKIFVNDFFQWYDLSFIKKDIEKAKLKTNRIYEFYSYPVENKIIIDLFENLNIKQKRKKPIIYNFKPKNGFYLKKKIIIKRIQKFINEYKS